MGAFLFYIFIKMAQQCYNIIDRTQWKENLKMAKIEQEYKNIYNPQRKFGGGSGSFSTPQATSDQYKSVYSDSSILNNPLLSGIGKTVEAITGAGMNLANELNSQNKGAGTGDVGTGGTGGGTGGTGSGTGGTGGTGSGEVYQDTSDIYNMLIQAQAKQMELERQRTIQAIEAQVGKNVRQYEQQLAGVSQQYQPLKNQSEVERYKARNALRESQANRGVLDAGLGRQENLELQTNYGNQLQDIMMQEQNTRDSINQAILDTKSEGELAKATGNANSISSVIDFLAQAITPAQLNTAQSALSNNYYGPTGYESSESSEGSIDLSKLSEEDRAMIKSKYGL